LTSEEQNIRLTIPAKAEYIGLCRLALAGLLRVRPIPEETLAELKLALTEACSNAVRHAYADGRPGQVEVVFWLSADRLVIDVLDDGEGFQLREPRAEAEDFDESGLGLAIIRSLTDGVEVHERENGRGARLRFSKSLAADQRVSGPR
jgi:serine/threonine-protein kinase RsbW